MYFKSYTMIYISQNNNKFLIENIVIHEDKMRYYC